MMLWLLLTFAEPQKFLENLEMAKAHAEVRDDKIVIVHKKKVVKQFFRNQEEHARSYLRGWNQLG